VEQNPSLVTLYQIDREFGESPGSEHYAENTAQLQRNSAVERVENLPVFFDDPVDLLVQIFIVRLFQTHSCYVVCLLQS
jgi:hypothetical protein